MPKAARKSYKKRPAPYKKRPLTKKINKVVKAVLTKQIETKYFQHLIEDKGVTRNIPISYNCFYHGVTRGTSDNQMLGDKLNWQGMSLKYRFYNAYLDSLVYTYVNWPQTVHVMLIETDQYAALVSLSYSDIWSNFTGSPETDFLKNGVRILAHNKHVIRPDASASTVPKILTSGNLKYFPKGGRKLQFKDSLVSTYELVNKNYYIVLVSTGLTAGTGGVTATFSGGWRNYFKDA